MEFLELVNQRYTERHFSERKVEEEKIQKILEAGRIAPTAKNQQPQKVYLIESKEAMQKLCGVTGMTYKAPVTLMICYDTNLSWKNPIDTHFVGYDSGEMDATIAATLMMMEATDLGVASIWAKWYDTQKLIDVFELPDNIRPALLLSLGYPNDNSDGNVKVHNTRNAMDRMLVRL